MLEIHPEWYAKTYDFLGGIPDQYLVCDVETNGPDPQSDKTLITQLGYFLKLGDEVETQWSAVLNWSIPELNIDQDWLKESIEKTREVMESKGRTYHTSYERICSEQSIDPREAFDMYHRLLLECDAMGLTFVGHNIWRFDRPVIERHLKYCGLEFYFPRNRVIDTGMVEKANMAGLDPPTHDFRSTAEWYEMVSEFRSYVQWNLDQHCGNRYGINEKYNIDPAEAHDAGFDCWFTHVLLQQHKKIVDSHNVREEGTEIGKIQCSSGS